MPSTYSVPHREAPADLVAYRAIRTRLRTVEALRRPCTFGRRVGLVVRDKDCVRAGGREVAVDPQLADGSEHVLRPRGMRAAHALEADRGGPDGNTGAGAVSGGEHTLESVEAFLPVEPAACQRV